MQQSAFQVRKHGIKGLDTAGGSIPDICVLDEVNDLSVLVNIQFLDQIVFNDLPDAHNTFICSFGCGAAVKNEHVFRIQLKNGY